MKKYEHILMEVLSFQTEDIIRTSSDFTPNESKENTEIMPEIPPFLPNA